MASIPVLRLNPLQIGQLVGYCAAYRSYLWQNTWPAPERNVTIRHIQVLQGKLEKSQEQVQAEHALFLAGEEQQTLKRLLSEMLRLIANAPSSEQRMRQVAEVAGLRVLVERTFRQAEAL